MELPMQKPHDDSKASLTAFVQDNTIVVVLELSLSSWLVAGMIPGLSREPLKKIAPDPEVLLRLLYRWRDEPSKPGKTSLGFRSGMKLAGTAFG
jgi:transposase